MWGISCSWPSARGLLESHAPALNSSQEQAEQPPPAELKEGGHAEMSLLLPPPGQITRRFTGHEVSYSPV